MLKCYQLLTKFYSLLGKSQNLILSHKFISSYIGLNIGEELYYKQKKKKELELGKELWDDMEVFMDSDVKYNYGRTPSLIDPMSSKEIISFYTFVVENFNTLDLEFVKLVSPFIEKRLDSYEKDSGFVSLALQENPFYFAWTFQKVCFYAALSGLWGEKLWLKKRYEFFQKRVKPQDSVTYKMGLLGEFLEGGVGKNRFNQEEAAWIVGCNGPLRKLFCHEWKDRWQRESKKQRKSF